MIDPELSALRQLPEIIGAVLSLNRENVAKLYSLPQARIAGWLILLSVGFSEALGQSIILFLNRVRPRQFLAALLSVSLGLTMGLFFWGLSNWLLANLVFDAGLSWQQMAFTLAFACSPLLFAFLGAMPYVGIPLYILIALWSLMAMTTGLEAVSDLGSRQALTCIVLGYIVFQGLRQSIGRPMRALARHMEKRLVGLALQRDIRTLYEQTQDALPKLAVQRESEPREL